MRLHQINEAMNAYPAELRPLFEAAEADGLPMDPESRKQRAEAMGFDTRYKFYHATTAAQDFEAFDTGFAGGSNTVGGDEPAIFLTNHPSVAASYLPYWQVREYSPGYDSEKRQALEREWHDLSNVIPHTMSAEIYQQFGGWQAIQAKREEIKARQAEIEDELRRSHKIVSANTPGSRIMPLWIRTKKLKYIDTGGKQYDPDYVAREIRKAMKAKKAGVAFLNMYDWGGAMNTQPRAAATVAMFDPRDIRSVFARFDPTRRDSPNLLD